MACGHSGAKALEIIMDAKRKDPHALRWIKWVRDIRNVREIKG